MGIAAGIMVPHPPMIVPAVGRGGEKQIEETTKAYEKAAQFVADLKPDTVILTSPHSVMYADYFHISPGQGAEGSFARFGAPQVSAQVAYDTEFVSMLCDEAKSAVIPAGTLGERDAFLDHGTLVPLYFLLQRYTDFKLVRIGLSGLSMSYHYKLGMEIAKVSKALDRRAVFIASGDLSHKLQDYGPYGFAKEGPVYDERIMDVMGRASFDELFDFDETFLDKAAECGHRSFVIMAGAFDRTELETEKLSHQDVTGVGYGVCTYKVRTDAQGEEIRDENRAFLDIWEERERERRRAARDREDGYVRLARLSLENYIITGEPITWETSGERILAGEASDEAREELKKELTKRQAGVFVSIHKEGRLRGCIGTIGPVTSMVANEIIVNAISASTKDPRFDPITRDELLSLEINVDVLSEPEPIDSEEELDVKRYGVIVTKGGRRGLLLPNLDGVDTIDEQLRIAKRKAGLDEEEQGVKLQRFEVVRHV